jgi:pimeloyl-ACP methyl ester carboxylesterase
MSIEPAPTSISATRVAGTGTTTRALVMLHGIYGRGRNWLGIARNLVEARAEYACWLVDLPYHGDSGPARHGDTVAGLAMDVGEWLEGHEVVPDAVLGHSYGGKVALALASTVAAARLQVWVIDSTPEAKPPVGSAWQMLRIVRELPQAFRSRDEATSAIVDRGLAIDVGQWMSSNLVRDGDRFVWRLDFDAMERLLVDFFATDLWPLIEHPPDGIDLHFLKASQSNALSTEAVQRLEAAGDRVHLHRRDGGHWIHAESPDVVTRLLLEYLP